MIIPTRLNSAKIFALVTLVSVTFMPGCNKGVADQPYDEIKYDSDKNILHFKSIGALKEQIDAGFADKAKQVADISARFPSFTSMEKIFDQFDKAEAAMVDKLPDSVKTGTNVNWNNYLRMSAIGKQYSNMILVKQFPGGDYYYDMNIRQRYITDLVNPEGLLVVNDSIYQFSENYVKIITNGDYSKLATLGTINTTNIANHILVIDSRVFIAGNFMTTAPAPYCFNVWSKSNTGTANDKRISLEVGFEQYTDSMFFNTTTCTAGVGIIERKIVFWFRATAKEIRLTGEFSAPRSPFNNVKGVLGYHYPNYFSTNYSGPIKHFTDIAFIYDPCYTMTSGRYTIYADFTGGGVGTTVSW